MRWPERYVAKLDVTGAQLRYATYLHTSIIPSVPPLAINSQTGTAYVSLNITDQPSLAVVNFHDEPPPLFLSGAGNSANRLGGLVAPGELLTLFGVGIGPADGISATPHLPILPIHIQDALITQQPGANAADHGVHELAESRPVKGAVRPKQRRAHNPESRHRHH
jgi:hypothetical protein